MHEENEQEGGRGAKVGRERSRCCIETAGA